MTTEVIHLSGLQASHEAIKALWKRLRTDLAFNRRFRLTVESEEADRRAALRKALHAVLGDIAEQVWFIDQNGQRYRHTLQAWKLWAKQQFLIDPAVSSEDMSNDEYADWLTRLSAYACVELGVHLSED